jgi:hypothetical protein
MRASRKSAAPFRCRLVIMVKLPVAGRVKTRLAREVGIAEATRFYRATMHAAVARLSRDPRWQTLLTVSPDTGAESPMLPRSATRLPQGAGDLGQRMQRPMRLLPPGPVCVVGTDIPAIRPAHIHRAFRALGHCDAVFGPAEDGGFWLVGMRRRPHLLWPYDGVAWSTAGTLASVAANLAGRSIAHTAALSDVDSAADLGRQARLIGRRILPAQPTGAPMAASPARATSMSSE